MIDTATNGLLRAVVSTLQTPVVIVLLVMLAFTVVMVGSFAVEFFTEHRFLSENIPDLIEKINAADAESLPGIVSSSKILNRQKDALSGILGAGDMSVSSREAYAAQLLFDEEEHYRKYLRHSETLLKLGPMFGLLGTLIPLGPGLIALGKGNTQALSESLLVAFDTTSLGVIIAAIAFVVYQIRKSWYGSYSQGLESMMEAVLEKMKTKEDNTEDHDA